MSDIVRYFRNAAATEESGGLVFPSGIVKVIDGHRAGRKLVEYVDPPRGFGGHRFHVDEHELSRITSPVFDVGNLWVVTHPQHPTFYLNGAINGITSAEHAARIAADIVGHPVDAAWHIDRLTDIIT